MSLAVVLSRAQLGLDAPQVTVEVHITKGLPALSLVGLPETAVKESRERVRSAIINTRHEFPSNRRITINLAPADLPKEGGRFDLPIALGILAASGQIPLRALETHEFVGELALTGQLRPVRGVLTASLCARDAGRQLVVPRENAEEAGLVEGARLIAADGLLAVCAHLSGAEPLKPYPIFRGRKPVKWEEDLADVRGQYQAKRALVIAAAGGHNVLMIGPPGTGKTMLASRLPGILPPMTEQEALSAAMVQSVSNAGLSSGSWGLRPFRAPHHTASGVALVGGGSQPRPGEISLAHNGVLFLDEFPEFDRRVLEVLREPLESGRIIISRAAHQAEFPARFQLVAAMNPCPCGYLGDGSDRCRCTPDQINRYRARISGPLLDRIDMYVAVPAVKRALLRQASQQTGEGSTEIRARVERARGRQLKRCGKANAHLSSREVERYCQLNDENARLLEAASARLNLSARAWHRVLKLARTIADLAESEILASAHISEAIGYRVTDDRQDTSV